MRDGRRRARLERRAQNRAPADYYPLANGWKWAYDVEKDGINILATYAVLERTGDVASVQAGDERLTYARDAPRDCAEGRGAHRRLPDQEPGPGRDRVAGRRGQRADRRRGPGGHAGARRAFAGCVVVEVTPKRSDARRADDLRARVGPVALELQVQDGQKFVTATRARLRAVTKPGEDSVPLKESPLEAKKQPCEGAAGRREPRRRPRRSGARPRARGLRGRDDDGATRAVPRTEAKAAAAVVSPAVVVGTSA